MYRTKFVEDFSGGESQMVESIDPCCSAAPEWDVRFHQCPARTDYNVLYCRILHRSTGFPEFCAVHTMRRKTVIVRCGQWINPRTPSDGVSNEEQEASQA